MWVMLIVLPQELSIVFVVKQKLLQKSALQVWLTAMDVLNCSEKIFFIEQVYDGNQRYVIATVRKASAAAVFMAHDRVCLTET